MRSMLRYTRHTLSPEDRMPRLSSLGRLALLLMLLLLASCSGSSSKVDAPAATTNAGATSAASIGGAIARPSSSVAPVPSAIVGSGNGASRPSTSGTVAAASSNGSQSGVQWTILVYMAADNNLEGPAL